MQPPRRSPIHERVPLIGRMRAHLRGAFFELLERVVRTDDGRSIFHGRHGSGFPPAPLDLDAGVDSPYPDLGRRAPGGAGARDDVVFITARFRSGSTLMWNLLREIPSCTAYYEPFNERRWFDPEHRQGHVDATHRGVQDYWREYDQLTQLSSLYSEEWNDRHFFMDERFWEPRMKAFVETMIDGAPGRPVLQFNRIDFRLPWFRQWFPRATILHVYRHPRDAWLSSLVDAKAYPPAASIEQFDGCDHFYLLPWARDLRHSFPVLDPKLHGHAYDLYYLVWKLSYLFGQRYAHRSIAFEDLAFRPAEIIPDLIDSLGIQGADLPRLVDLVDPPTPEKWRRYADDDWFGAREARCEALLADFLQAWGAAERGKSADPSTSGLSLV